MARLVSLARSGILRETPLAPSRAVSDDEPAPAPLTPREQQTVREAQDDFVTFLQHVFPLSFEGQRFLWADGTYHDFTLGDFHIQLARLIQRELEGGGKSRFAFMAPPASPEVHGVELRFRVLATVSGIQDWRP